MAGTQGRSYPMGVEDVAVQLDGRILLVGNFVYVGNHGTQFRYFVRLSTKGFLA